MSWAVASCGTGLPTQPESPQGRLARRERSGHDAVTDQTPMLEDIGRGYATVVGDFVLVGLAGEPGGDVREHGLRRHGVAGIADTTRNPSR